MNARVSSVAAGTDGTRGGRARTPRDPSGSFGLAHVTTASGPPGGARERAYLLASDEAKTTMPTTRRMAMIDQP